MFRSHTCGELRLADAGKNVTLAGWVQRARKMGGMTFVDLRDRYGITQLVFNAEVNADLCEQASHLGREFVVQVTGEVNERSNKNTNIPTGEIEIIVSEMNVLNSALTPPFTIEDNSDGGDDIRMKYRYLDLRRNPVRKNLELRHQMTMEVRRYLDSKGFLEIETPMLVGSTPEGARDFVVPSRMNPGQFYALPQSPQTLKQLLMVSGMDRYFQIVKCFRDEDLRADRQPEFTQIDCEMSFVEQEDAISFHTGIYHTLGADLRTLHIVCQLVKLLAGIGCSTFGTDTTDVFRTIEHGETVSLHDVHQFNELHAKAEVGLVATIIFHGICPRHAQERFGQFHAAQLLEQVLGHTFKGGDDILLFHETHFAIDLRKLRLAVGAKVLIAETFYNLEISVHTAHHEKLLQCLRALGEGQGLVSDHLFCNVF